jgi:toxin HigB-1
VIQSFKDAATEGIFKGENSRVVRRLPGAIWPVARRKLDMLNAAHILADLRSPPGNRLEALRGD